MKKWLLPLIAIGLIFMVGCGEAERKPLSTPKVEELTPAGEILKGEHQLRKVAAKIDVDSRTTTSYFMFTSVREGSNIVHNFSVKFSWMMNDGSYMLSSLPLDKIRVRFDVSYEVPTIKFRWKPSKTTDISELMRSNIVYAVITTKESDWPIPLNSLFIVNDK